MRVLWLCNIVLPEFADEFGFKKHPFGGWMSGLLENIKDQVELGLCFPIHDVSRMKDGNLNGVKYYSYHDENRLEPDEEQQHRFSEIIGDFRPDVIHLWGTEYLHSYNMVMAAEKWGLLSHVAVHIQGLVSLYARKYLSGIDMDIVNASGLNDMVEGRREFEVKGKYEKAVLKKVRYADGNSDWADAAVHAQNPGCKFSYISEVLRKEFYQQKGTWSYDKCKPHLIMVSQASYPIKGFHYLVKALEIVKRDYPDTKVVVAGNDPSNNDYGKYLQLITRKDIGDIIEFVGEQDADQMINLYREANVFVSASTIENTSNSIGEAMMIGTPVVASDVGGTNSLIRHKESGFLLPEQEIEMLAFYIERCFIGSDEINQLSREEVRKALIANNKEKAWKDTLSTYKNICDQ